MQPLRLLRCHPAEPIDITPVEQDERHRSVDQEPKALGDWVAEVLTRHIVVSDGTWQHRRSVRSEKGLAQ